MRNIQSIELQFGHLPAGDDAPAELNAIIRLPGQSTAVTYEGDAKYNLLRVSCITGSGSRFWQNYGFVPGTLAQDGDPLDIVVLAPYPLERLSVVASRPIGMLSVTHRAATEEKVIAMVSDRICAACAPVQRLEDLGDHALRQMKAFFENYCGVGQAQAVRCGDWGDVDAAQRVILGAIRSFEDNVSCMRR
ncbi:MULTISPECIES: inorganic diphosphatase [Burkholderiaceae]|jgi:inorganic pyrophosphatase|uniref:inorganic diphosphatase n=1 Tax=Burkholderia vietnamiensis TaxID=60552 RepID=A0AAW7TBA9_BURVI|nr:MULTISPECIES: inorganic diphosphatase [Burkholderiaceae]MDN7799397.1 inorganic diphosphatase [Burkholderia vietnamiensis]RFU44296.1 inorganic pyrophosphatase [Paraburkholderia sp. DHOC27]